MMFKRNVITAVGDWMNHWFQFNNLLDSDQQVCETRDVEFIGGPFDGLIRQVDACEYWQLSVLEKLPSPLPSLNPPMEQQPPQRNAPRTVATYLLDCTGTNWCYRYQGTALCAD